MKKSLTRGEKWLFASPLLFLVLAGLLWQRQRRAPASLEIAETTFIYNLEFSPDSGRLLVAFLDNTTDLFSSRVYDLQSNSKWSELELPPRMNPRLTMTSANASYYDWFSWSGDGNSILGSNSSDLAVWDVATGTVKLACRYGASNNIWRQGELRFSPDAKTLLGEDLPASVYDATTGKRLKKGGNVTGRLNRVELSQNGHWLADIYGRVLDYKTREVIWKSTYLWQHDYQWSGDVMGVRCKDNPNGRRFFMNLWLWNASTRQQLQTPPIGSELDCQSFAFSPDKRTLVSINGQFNTLNTNHSAKCEVVAWDFVANRVLWNYNTDSEIYAPQWSPDGKWLAVLATANQQLGNSDTLLVFDQSGQLRLQREEAGIFSWSPDSKRLAVTVATEVFLESNIWRNIEIHRFAE